MPNDYYDRLDIDGDNRPIQDTAGRALIAGLDTDKADRSELATVATTGDYNDLSNLPTIPAAQVPSDWDATAGVARILNKPNLSAVATSGNYSDLIGAPTLATVATSGDYDDLSNLPFIPSRTSQLLNDSEFVARPSLAPVALSGDYDDLSNKPNLAAVATSGDYDDLSNAPLLATVATTGEYNDLVNPPALAQVATTGDYNDLGNLPILAPVATSGDYDDLTDKPTFKTINGNAITGTGNIETPYYSYKSGATFSGVVFNGLGGYITTGSTDLWFFVPFAMVEKVPDITKFTLELVLRTVDGGYPYLYNGSGWQWMNTYIPVIANGTKASGVSSVVVQNLNPGGFTIQVRFTNTLRVTNSGTTAIKNNVPIAVVARMSGTIS